MHLEMCPLVLCFALDVLRWTFYAFCAGADHEVANVGYEAEGLAYDEDGVVADYAVGNDA